MLNGHEAGPFACPTDVVSFGQAGLILISSVFKFCI